MSEIPRDEQPESSNNKPPDKLSPQENQKLGLEVPNSKIQEASLNFSDKLLEMGKDIRSLIGDDDKENAKKLFDSFVKESEPIVRFWLEKFDIRKNPGNPHYSYFIDDAIQETYFHIFQKFDRYFDNFVEKSADRRNSVLAWLYVAAKYSYTSQMRKQLKIENIEQNEERAQISLEKDLVDTKPEPWEEIALKEEEVALKEIDNVIKNFVSQMGGAKLKKMATLIYVEKLPKEEIMKTLDINDHNFRARLQHIRRAIKKIMKKTGFEEMGFLLEDSNGN